MMDGDTPYILHDIADAEDFAGDMDFKVTGTEQGITAIQMDMKLHGLPVSILKMAITGAKTGRAFILNHMLTTMAQPRPSLSPYAPRIEKIKINPEKIGAVIGKGGEERVALQNKLTKEYGKTVIVNVIEVKSASTNAQLVAEDIARQLENRVTFRRAMKQCMRNAMSPRDRSTVPAKGIKAMCSGRLGGADIARTESYHEGTIPLQTLRADIDYGFAEAATTYGRIGVKVWVYKGEVLKSAKTAQKKEGGNK
jgi:small subunit ribosomal protein S3